MAGRNMSAGAHSKLVADLDDALDNAVTDEDVTRARAAYALDLEIARWHLDQEARASKGNA